MSQKVDQIYSNPLKENTFFQFDERVAEVFPDMISRSVPGYAAIINGIGKLAQRFVQPNTRIYDLGASLGAATLSMRQALGETVTQIIAVDNSQAMVKRCTEYQQAYRLPSPVEVIHADLLDIEISNASVVVLNFTLQFIAPQLRQKVIDKIYHGLVTGGALVVSEKLSFDDPIINDQLIELHHEFKRANGYSDLEISQKRQALEKVMITDTGEQHFERFRCAGFSHYAKWHQQLNFASMVAIK